MDYLKCLTPLWNGDSIQLLMFMKLILDGRSHFSLQDPSFNHIVVFFLKTSGGVH